MLQLNLKELRLLLSAQQKMDISLADVARATNIHQTLYGRYEANKVRRPDLDNIEKLYIFFKQSKLIIDGRPFRLDDLFDIKDTKL